MEISKEQKFKNGGNLIQCNTDDVLISENLIRKTFSQISKKHNPLAYIDWTIKVASFITLLISVHV